MPKSSLKNFCIYRYISIAAMTALLNPGASIASGNEVNFSLTDNPARWFDTGATIAGTRSLAVAKPGVRVNFSGNQNQRNLSNRCCGYAI